MATIRDVARIAEVSVSTVSNVINGRGFVEESLRLRVEEAIGALNYMPNNAARHLRRQPRAQRAIKVLGLSSLEGYTEGTTVMTDIIRTAARESGLQLMEGLCAGDNIDEQNRLIAGLVDREVDALICFPADCEGIEESIRLCNLRNIPFIALNRPVLGGEVAATIKSDDYMAGYSLGLYASLTRREGMILELEYKSADFNQLDRRRGFQDVVEGAPHLELRDRLVVPWSVEKNWDEALGVLVETLARRPEVNIIYCHSDELAALALKSLAKIGRLHPADEPEHCMILGVDGNRSALTAIGSGLMDATAEQMLLHQAQRAVQIALQVIENGPSQQRILVEPTRLVHRGNIDCLKDFWALRAGGETGIRAAGAGRA